MKSASNPLEQKYPELPAAYDLVFFEQVESIRQTAVELAEQGHEEGTLIWALNQSRAKARLNKNWICSKGDLHCAMILKPDFDQEKYDQILLVAIISLGNAIASHVSAMTALGYNWPNDVSIANHKIASVWLDQSKSNTIDWLIISLSVNIENTPQDQDFYSMSIRQAQGTSDVTNDVILETFAREFIKQLNNWDERGYDYIYKQWIIRLQNADAEITFQTPQKTYAGITKGVNENGSLILDNKEGDFTTITIVEYMELNECS